MSENDIQLIKRFLKWGVPKVTGVFILIAQLISAKGQLPKSKDDFIWIAVGVGIVFASNGKKAEK